MCIPKLTLMGHTAKQAAMTAKSILYLGMYEITI